MLSRRSFLVSNDVIEIQSLAEQNGAFQSSLCNFSKP